MRVVVQRVSEAHVAVENIVIGKINQGLLVYLSVAKTDAEKDAEFIADKLVNLRIFADDDGKMNRSILDIGGKVLLVSNFTLHGDCRKGRRPGFDLAAEPGLANQLYERVGQLVAQQGVPVEKGIFAAHMKVASINYGPITFVLDSSRLC
jgi:D-aminoacyl-tRNA deacylase